MSELLSCPFCGGAPYMRTEHDADDVTWHYICCQSCGARTHGKWHSAGNDSPQHRAEVRDEWQARASAATQAAGVVPPVALPALTDPVPGYLFIAMDDDGVAWPEFCPDENAVLDAVKRAMYFRPEALSEEDTEHVELTAAELVENGYVGFEGDPPLHLYKLRDGKAVLAASAAPASPLPMPAPQRPTREEAMQALEWLYNHPKSDAYTEYTALLRFIEQAPSAAPAPEQPNAQDKGHLALSTSSAPCGDEADEPELIEIVRKALHRAYSLGQTYWAQADSESYAANKRSEETAAKMEQLSADTLAALSAVPPTVKE